MSVQDTISRSKGMELWCASGIELSKFSVRRHWKRLHGRRGEAVAMKLPCLPALVVRPAKQLAFRPLRNTPQLPVERGEGASDQ